LVLKKQGHYPEALQCFQRFSGSLALLPTVAYQISNLLELKGDSEAAADMYQQLLGLVPTDAGALQKMGELYDHDGDKQQAHHYHIEVGDDSGTTRNNFVSLSGTTLRIYR
jgi:intraflagellar transport protein 88